MNKKITAIMAVVMISLVLFTGCKKTEEPKEPEENPSNNQSTTNPPVENPVETMKTGVITEASMHYVQIEAPDGTTYSFAVSDETKTDGQGENLGDTLQVTYTGEYKPMIVAAAVSVLEKSKAVADAPKDDKNNDDGHIRYIVGVVEDASMHVISVSWQGKVYNIAKDDNTAVEGSIVLGATVEVYHKGNMKEGVLATKIVVKNAPEKPVEAAENSMTGIIMDAANNTVIIRARDGETYTFGKDDKTKVDADLEIGKTIKVTFSGELGQTPMATEIGNSVITAQN